MLEDLENEIKIYGTLEEYPEGPLEQINYFLSEVNKQNFTQDQYLQIDQYLQNLIQEAMTWMIRNHNRKNTRHATKNAYEANMGSQLIEAHNVGPQLPSVLMAKTAAREARETMNSSEKLLLLHHILGKTGKIAEQNPKSAKIASAQPSKKGARRR